MRGFARRAWRSMIRASAVLSATGMLLTAVAAAGSWRTAWRLRWTAGTRELEGSVTRGWVEVGGERLSGMEYARPFGWTVDRRPATAGFGSGPFAAPDWGWTWRGAGVRVFHASTEDGTARMVVWRAAAPCWVVSAALAVLPAIVVGMAIRRGRRGGRGRDRGFAVGAARKNAGDGRGFGGDEAVNRHAGEQGEG